jgi:hypothetical protein
METTPLTSQQQSPGPQFPVQFWADPEKKLMFRVVSPTELILLQILGRDIGGPFSHCHRRVTYPDPDRLQADLEGMKLSDAWKWEDLMNEYLQVNKVKLEVMNTYRQSQYEKGGLR